MNTYTIRITKADNTYANYIVEAQNLFFAKIQVRNAYFRDNPSADTNIKLSLTETFEKVEVVFFKEKCSGSLELFVLSGSCGLVSIIFDNKVYIVNIGDSRAIMSMNNGEK